MKEIAVSKFKATCLSLLDRIARTGQSILITKKGKPLAQVLPPPVPERKKSWLGSRGGSGKIVGDTVSPAVDADDWKAFKR